MGFEENLKHSKVSSFQAGSIFVLMVLVLKFSMKWDQLWEMILTQEKKLGLR